MNEIEEYDIIGFSKYVITSDCVVIRKDTRKHLRNLNYSTHKGDCFTLVRDDGIQKQIRGAHLLYCASKNIDVSEVSRKIMFTFRGNIKSVEEIVVYDVADMAAQIRKKKLSIEKTTYYKEVIIFSQAILSGNQDEIYRELIKYEEEIKREIRRYYRNEDMVMDRWIELISEILTGINEGRLFPVHPLRYMKKYLRREIKKYLSNKKEISFSELSEKQLKKII
ncbi:MAG: hypothetical protein LBU27_00795 [Candidatus Peribacteria bacterium]|jgi:hypothetical protein|nr:hypothetical protein [Candidatus Peribacteria bacterium]